MPENSAHADNLAELSKRIQGMTEAEVNALLRYLNSHPSSRQISGS